MGFEFKDIYSNFQLFNLRNQSMFLLGEYLYKIFEASFGLKHLYYITNGG